MTTTAFELDGTPGSQTSASVTVGATGTAKVSIGFMSPLADVFVTVESGDEIYQIKLANNPVWEGVGLLVGSKVSISSVGGKCSGEIEVSDGSAGNPARAPQFKVAPFILYRTALQVGTILTGDRGWLINGKVVQHEWLRNGVPIAGASEEDYLLSLADVGTSIAYRPTATGIGGSTTATSAAVGPIAMAVLPQPTISLSSNASVSEGDSGLKSVFNTITVVRDGAEGSLVVNLTYSGTATSGVDYAAPPAQVVIPAGQNSTTFPVNLVGDTALESSETIVIAAALAAYPSATASRTLTVTNDDVLIVPEPTISLGSNVSTSEGDSGTKTVSTTVTVVRDGVTGALVVNLTYGGTASVGSDYVAGPSSVTIPSGSNTIQFNLTINGDTTVEPSETIVIGAALVAYPEVTASRTVTLSNDDDPAVPTGPLVILLPLTGQSNRIGRQPYDGTDTTEADVYAYVGDPADPAYQTIVAYGNGPLKFPEGKQDYDASAGVNMQYSIGPNHELIKKVKAKYPDAKIVVVPCAVGASSLMSGSPPVWQGSATPGGGGVLFEQAVNFTNDARAKALVQWPGANIIAHTGWVQGDQESTTRAAYEAALTNLITCWRSRVTGVTHGKFIIGSVIPERWVVGSPSYLAGVAAVNAAQVDVSLSVADVIYVPGPDVRGGNDGLHYGPYSVNQTFGQRQGDSLTDITGPSVTTAPTQGGLVGTTTNILLTHNDPWGHGTFHFAGGANDALFQITDPYVNGTTQPQVHLIDNNTPAGVYELKVRARNGRGNFGPIQTIEFTQAVPTAVPVTENYGAAYNLNGFGASSVTIDIKEGVNLFEVAFPSGASQGADMALTVNGNPATKLGYYGTGTQGTTVLFAYESVTDVAAAAVNTTWGSVSLSGPMRHVWLTGVQAAPTEVQGYHWASGRAGNPQTLASMACPDGGVIIGFFNSDQAFTTAVDGTTLIGTSTGTFGRVGYRTTTGQVAINGGGSYASAIGAAFAKIP